MLSSKNLKYKAQQDAQRVPHYGLRKLSVGVASVLLGTVVYMQNSSTVHADVNPTVSAGNDSVKIADKNVGVGYSTGAASGINSTDSANSVVAAGGATDSTASSHSAASPVQRSTGQGNNAAAAVGESESGASAGQAKPGVNQVVASDNIEAVAGSVIGPNRPASVAAGNSSRGHSFANLSVKPSFLAVSKVASTGTFNDAVNGGFDQSTWGKLDVNAWQGHVQGDYYQLTDYTGDANHVIVPNEADFAKAGISTSGKQVGVTSDLMHRIFRDKTTAQDATVAFSKTDNKQIKAINADWENTWGHRFRYDSKGKLSKFDGTNLDVSNVTNMSDMFSSNQINDLSSLAYWKVDNVTNMGDMFEINQINNISPLANWKTANVTDMNGMFGWNKITDLSPLTNWKVDNVTDMSKIFWNNQISDLSPLTNWKVDNVTNMGEMFKSNQVSDLNPLANWKVDNVTNMDDMFKNNQISDLSPLTNWKVDNVTNMSDMFGSNQISDLSPLANWKVDNVTNMNDMFGWNKITDLSSLANWKVGKVIDMGYMFIWNKITDLSPLASWKVDKVTNMGEMFESNQISDLSPLTNWKVDKVTNMDEMFESNQISDLSPLANWKVDNVTNMSEMFEDNQISNLSPLANWKVDNVTNMHGMFEINRISDLSPLANWKVDNVTNMHGMFEINRISDLSPLANWKVNNVTDMSGMFFNNQISDLSPLTNWKVNNVTNMSHMFNYNITTQTKNLQAKRVINFAYPDGYTGKKQDPVTQTIDVPQRVNVELITKDSKPSNNILDWVTKTKTPETPAPVYFQDYTVPAIKGLLEPDKTAIAGQQADITKPINVTVTYKLLESNTNDAFALDSKNGLHEHANVNDNGGYDADFWGKLNVDDWNYTVNGDTITINGLKAGISTGANDAVIVPNLDDFKLVGKDGGAKTVYISKDALRKTAVHKYYGLSKTNGNKFTTDSNINSTFKGNNNLTHADLDSLNTGNVTDMHDMFNEAKRLVSLDVSNWTTGNVTDMGYMFANTDSLTSLDVSNWDTGKVTDMEYMFKSASSLTSLDVSNWNLTKLANEDSMQYIFAGDPNLTVIANDLKLPIWYQNEINDANYFWNNHMAVITNVPELIRSTGAINDLKIDNQDASRSIFYDSKGSSDAIQVLKQANQAYIKQYQNDHPGYILNLAMDVDQTDPIALANAWFVSVPREVQFTIAYYDLTGKQVDATTSTHKVGETVTIAPVAPANYVLANGQLKMNYLMHWGLNEADFLVAPKVTTTTETKSVSRTITVQIPAGQTNNVVQTVTFVRTGYLNQVTKQTTYSAWSFGGHYQFSGYQPQPIDGYTADVIPALSVTPDSSDTTVNVAYHPISVVYSVDYQLANSTAVKNVVVTPDRDGMIHLTAPKGYRLLTTVSDVQVGHSSQKLVILVAADEQTYSAHDALPNTVTEPLNKTVTRTVKITMPNGRVRTVKQSVKFERTATVKADGSVTYGNWQAIGRAQFNKVFVPKQRGYHLVIMDASGKALPGVEKIDQVTAEMNDAVVNVKYVKD